MSALPSELLLPGESPPKVEPPTERASALPEAIEPSIARVPERPSVKPLGDPLDDPAHPLFDTLAPPTPDTITSLQDQREWFARMCFALLGEVSTWRRVKRAILYGNNKEFLEALRLVSTSALAASTPKDVQTAPIAIQIINNIPRPEGAPPIQLAPSEVTALP